MNALIFDMDGVVVDSVGYWNSIREEIIQTELDVKDVDVGELVGMNANDEYDHLSSNYDLSRTKDAYQRLIEAHAEEVYRQRVTLFPDLREIINVAIDNGVELGIVSASNRTRVEMVLERFDIDQYFEVVVAGDDISGPSKPDPAIYEHALSQLQAPSDECVTVEDSGHGVTAANGAGLYCIGYAHHPGQPLANADETFQNPGPLQQRLEEFCQQDEGNIEIE